MKVRLQDAMLSYACNQKGCCCKGWAIPFQGDDVGRMLVAFNESEREAILEGAQVDVDPEGNLKHIRLRSVGDSRACQFLEEEGLCHLHDTKGVEVLPHLCRSFPAFSYDLMGERELIFDAICPEVLRCLASTDDPIHLVEMDVGKEQPDLAERASFPKALPGVVFGESDLNGQELAYLRGVILASLNERNGAVLSTLACINHGLVRTLNGEKVTQFHIKNTEDIQTFDTFFDQCYTIHAPTLLARFLMDYRRFVFVGDLNWENDSSLVSHLKAAPNWRGKLDPHLAELEPLLYRYLSHRFFGAFDRSPSANRLEFSYGTINHCLAVAFRYVIALSSWQQKPIDKDLMVVALGAAEYVFRVFRVPQFSMPWFGVERVEMGLKLP